MGGTEPQSMYEAGWPGRDGSAVGVDGEVGGKIHSRLCRVHRILEVHCLVVLPTHTEGGALGRRHREGRSFAIRDITFFKNTSR